MMKGTCQICGKPAILNCCNLCGKQVCSDCYVSAAGLCIDCARKTGKFHRGIA